MRKRIALILIVFSLGLFHSGCAVVQGGGGLSYNIPIGKVQSIPSYVVGIPNLDADQVYRPFFSPYLYGSAYASRHWRYEGSLSTSRLLVRKEFETYLNGESPWFVTFKAIGIYHLVPFHGKVSPYLGLGQSADFQWHERLNRDGKKTLVINQYSYWTFRTGMQFRLSGKSDSPRIWVLNAFGDVPMFGQDFVERASVHVSIGMCFQKRH